MEADQIALIQYDVPQVAKRIRRSAPRQGMSLAIETELRGGAVRQAVKLLAESFPADRLEQVNHAMFAPRWQVSAPRLDRVESLERRAAWNLVSVWCLAHSSGEVAPRSGLEEAERWFRGSASIPSPLLTGLLKPDALWRAHQELLNVPIDHDFWDLFPYILEEHGPGSRASVMRDAATAVAREAKRREGVFYTPSDVADYMVRHTLDNFEGRLSQARCLDPACGTAVFLLALCRAVAARSGSPEDFDPFLYITSCVYGCDISAHAVDAAAFVLLRECLSAVRRRKLSPWAAWHAIRLNLAQIDSLTLAPVRAEVVVSGDGSNCRLAIRRLLLDAPEGWVEPVTVSVEEIAKQGSAGLIFFGRKSVPLSALFAEAACGFEILIGNPPYSPLGRRDDYNQLAVDYRSLAHAQGGSRENCFPLFIEMMWRLTVPGVSASALVTPLSIAFHGGAQYEHCRHAMSWQGGRWQFAFFDREPHALFGEEVKTRNAILFRFDNPGTARLGEPAEIETGPLRKWTSRTREELFQRICFTPLGTPDITFGIPKLSGAHQAHAFTVLRQRHDRLTNWTTDISTCEPRTAFETAANNRVFVGGTAYNFLNVYRPFLLTDESPHPISDSSIHCLQFRTEAESLAGLAVLSSRLAFWIWHVLGDGFHVAGWLFEQIPFARASLSPEKLAALSEVGAVLWKDLQTHRIVSVNGGKRTIAFRPLACNKQRDVIDAILVEVAGLPGEFAGELKNFVQQIVLVDPTDSRRRHLQNYFEPTPKT